MPETPSARQAGYRMDRGRWARLSFDEQMGNIGSEVGRAIAARRAGKPLREERAIARAIDLFGATAEVWVGTLYSYRLREVLRSRDEFLRLFYDGTFEDDADNIERYFLFFAWRARSKVSPNYNSMISIESEPLIVRNDLSSIT